MRAVTLHGYGGPEVLKVEEVPDPEIGPQDLLIEVHAAAVNPIDCKLRGGGYRALVRMRFPWVLGLDVSGVVRAVGAKVRRFAVGDEVFASPTHKRFGSYAELMALDESLAAPKPKNLTHQQAAAVPLAGQTAWQALVEVAQVAPGQRVLITAGSGGVGTFAIQIARLFRANVTTTCSARNRRLVTELGADQVIDYTQEDFAAVLRDLDVVLDAHGGEDTLKALRVLRSGGCLAWIAADVEGRTARFGPWLGVASVGASWAALLLRARLLYGVRAPQVLMESNGARLAKLAELCEAGAVRPVVDRVFGLNDVAEAHRTSETGRARGKLVIAVR